MKALQRKFLAALLALSLLAGLLPATGTTAQAAVADIGETVTFAGHEWYIIGTPSEGVTAPEGCYTLFAKNNDFGATTFRAGANQHESGANIYKDSDLQKAMERIAQDDNYFSDDDRSNIVPRDTFDYIEGDPPAGQLLWPISASAGGRGGSTSHYYGEVTAIDSSLLKFDASYWTRSNWTKSVFIDKGTYYHAVAVSSDGGVMIDGFYEYGGTTASEVTETHAIRPALYVKQEAVTFESAFYVGANTITSATVGENLVANAGQGVPLLTDSSLVANVLVNESGGRTQSGASLSFRLSELHTSSGANQVVACVLTDSTGAVKYYGKLADLSQALSGWRDLSVPLAGVANGTYTLSIFAHNTATNAVSAPTPTMTVTVSNGTGTVSNYNGGTYVDGGTALNFTQHPQSLEVKLNETATFSVEVVTGDGSDANITYTWKVQSPDGQGGWYTIQDADTGQNYNNSSITFTNLTGTWADNGFSLEIVSYPDKDYKISDGLRIRCMAKSPSAHFAEESNVATLTVDPAPAFTQQPQDQTVEAGGSTSFSAEAVATSTITYTWQAQPKTSDPERNMWYDIYDYVPNGVSFPCTGQSLYLPNVSGSWQDNEKILHDGHSTVSVSGFDPAEARFRCVAKDGSGRVIYSEPAELTVTGGLVSGVSVTPSTATVEKGGSQQFSATVSGTGDYDQSVRWSVEGAESASTTISTSGLLSVGADETATTLTVTATSTADDSKSGTAAVTVTEGTAPEPTTVTAIAGYGGSIDQSTFTATADSGFVIDQLWVDGVEVSAASGKESYTCADTPTNSVFVTFAYTVEVETPANGTLTVTRSGASLTSGSLVRPGDELAITATPASGYTLTALSVNGASVTPEDNVYTYTVGSQPTQTRSVGDATVAAAGAVIAASFSEEEDPDDQPVTPPEEEPDDPSVNPPEEEPAGPSEPSDPADPGDSDEPAGPATEDSDGWRDIQDEIASAEDGDKIVVDMNGSTEVPKEIFETVAGKDVDVTFELEDGVSWTVNGADIPTDADLSDLDLGVDLGTDGIPVDVINRVTGEVGTVQITLAHDGDFGFAMTMTAPLGEENAGYWANLYHYDEDAEAMTFETAAKIDDAGYAALLMRHASQYAIVIDDHSHAALSVSDIFVDVEPDAWYTDAVQYAYDHGLMTGTSATTFAPDATTTRAMIVSILARQENVTSAEDAGFTDVDENDWFATAVNWAAREGIVAGFEDDSFRPNEAITREQLAAILCNYSAWKGEDTSARADLDEYTDAISISSWATDTMSWAVAEQLLAGVTENTLEPQGAATRAQVAAVLQRFLSE